MRLALLVLLAASIVARAADLKAKLDGLIAQEPALRGATVGFQVVSLADGHVAYEHDAGVRLIPASNMKLFTTALALEKLGPEYRFQTVIGADRPIDAKGRLASDLVLVGGGDPSLSGRTYPYEYHASPDLSPYSFRGIEAMADQLLARGLKRVDGSVVGDDRRYVWEPHAADWAMDDAVWSYGSPVSALILDDNSFALTLKPGAPGELASITLTPPFEYFAVENLIRTEPGAQRKVEIERSPAGRQLRLSGVLPPDDPGYTTELAVDDPAVYAAAVLRGALERRGVAVRGGAIARHRFPKDAAADSAPAVVLATRSSPPLARLLEVIDKVSQNLHAEAVLREAGVVLKHEGSREAGLAATDDFLDGIGVRKASYAFYDGSGLARNTMVTTDAIVRLLVHMDQSSRRVEWQRLLPGAGSEGTLAKRFADHPEARRIGAKTGSLAHVRALSGYVDSASQGRLAFSLLVNNFDASDEEIARVVDQLALTLAE